MYTLKSIARRGTALGSAVALVAATLIPTASVFADALNPLTDRSLTLSSSAPGWDFKDGSGNATYAPPNSGANGKKTGNIFSFKVSTDSVASGNPIKGITLQYCTTPAGNCLAPGDNGYGATTAPSAVRVNNSTTTDAARTSDLDIVTSSPSELSALTGTIDPASGETIAIPSATGTGNNFVVYYLDTTDTTAGAGGTWKISSGWTMTAQNNETFAESDALATGANNQITLKNSTGQGLTSGQQMKIVFFGTNSNYITNPGSGAFFVRINTYKDDTTLTNANLIDGGVTVANVMNQSIWIQTKVLETMDFSVGTIDPYTLSSGTGSQLETATAVSGRKHTPCDRVLTRMNPSDPDQNILKMGDPNGEYSLSTGHTYSTHSYWRLSSNSSAGATVYYSGNTLSNTVGDKIKPIDNGSGNAVAPVTGSEQFGLALANGDGTDLVAGPPTTQYKVNYTREDKSGKVYEYGADDTASGLVALTADQALGSPTGVPKGLDTTVATDLTGVTSYHDPMLYPLTPKANYRDGAGIVNDDYGTINTQFAFNENSQQIPIALASENSQVVDCVTGKMRYIANIAATTPAGIYTTKINYIASPQY